MKVTLRIHSRLKVRLVGAVREANNATLARAAPLVVDALSRVADTELHNTASLYKEGLRDAVQVQNGALKIELTGATKDLELGYPARDMKPALLRSPSAKQGKKGRYIDISFRHKMSTDSHQGMPAEVKAKVQAATRAERISARREGRAERNPLRVTGAMPGSVNVQQRYDRRGKTKKVAVERQTSIYSHMFRTKIGKSAVYSTIRRISANSDGNSWWHPGFKGIHAIEKVIRDVKATLKVIYKQELGRKGLKTR